MAPPPSAVGVFVCPDTTTQLARRVSRPAARRQVVVDRGLYVMVRHPMYAGGIPCFVGMALWLGSYAAALAVAVPLAILIARIHVEERLLRRELPEYEAYMRKVRWRMVPGVW